MTASNDTPALKAILPLLLLVMVLTPLWTCLVGTYLGFVLQRDFAVRHQQ
jgi:hypothetical protein